jgi:pimeloyl-ACP methyl ester carboxylesterase
MNMRDVLTTDPDPSLRPRATTPVVELPLEGVNAYGVLHLPAGPGPHPVVIVLHGFPGYERNFDLAQALRRGGYAALVFHYRGSWGVPGTWTWSGVLHDAANAVAAVRRPDFLHRHRLDGSRIALIGHSLGGFAALMTAAVDEEIGAVGSVAGFDFRVASSACRTDPQTRAAFVRDFDDMLAPLNGATGELLVEEMETYADQWQLTRLAPAFRGRPVLLVGTGNDAVTPAATHHLPLVKAFEAQPRVRLQHVVFPTDHALSDHRIALTRRVVDFLDDGFGARA